MKKQLLVKTVFSLLISMNVLAQNVPNYVPTNGLVGYWPFNGNANDVSPNANNGNNNGATLTNDRFGNSNSAFVFNGSSSIDIGNLAVSNLKTYSFWIYPTDLSGVYRTVMSKFEGNSSLVSFEIGQREAQKMGFVYSTTGTNGYFTNSQSSLNINTWYNFVITIDNNFIKMYVNGTLEQTSTYPGVCFDNGDNVFIGATRNAIIGNPSSFFWIGKIDDVGIWNRALTQEEITALYTAGTQSALSSTKVFVDAPATVNQNQEVEMSISTEALNTADNVIAYQTDFSYDTTRYTYVSNNLIGTLNPAGNAVVNSTKKGKLAISYMSQTALSGAGSLVKLKFKANNTLGQGIFGLSNFLYNTTAISSLKNDTVNTIDVTPPTAKITYSQNPVRKGDSLLITVKFNEKMADAPVPQLNLTGQNTLTNTNLTKVNDTTYTYWWVVEKGNGTVNVNLATGKDVGGNVIVATPKQNPSFTVLPTMFGDIDTNKLVQAYDAALALQYSVGLNPLPTMDPLPWSNWRLAVANVDTVGNVSANDAALILQHSAKLIATFPADAKKRGADAPVANVTVTQEGNQLVFRTTGTLYAFNVFMKDHFNVLGQPEVKDKNAMVASNITTTTYNVGLASTTPFTENEPFLIIPILSNDNLQ